MTIESLRYDIKEKTELLQEASKAIEVMEGHISTMSVEREDERSRLEDKLKQLEDDLGDQTSSILFGTQLLMDNQNTALLNSAKGCGLQQSANANSSMMDLHSKRKEPKKIWVVEDRIMLGDNRNVINTY